MAQSLYTRRDCACARRLYTPALLLMWDVCHTRHTFACFGAETHKHCHMLHHSVPKLYTI
jgi:hypothetical protein